MKTAGIGEDADGLVVYNRSRVDLARHYGFQPKACRPYRAKTKGKVERPFLLIPPWCTEAVAQQPASPDSCFRPPS
jgi:hypothetical protein